MGSFIIQAVMQAIDGYHTFEYVPWLSDGASRHLSRDGAFQLAIMASYECLKKFSAEKINAESLDRLLLSQGVRSAVDYDVILEPVAVHCHNYKHTLCYRPNIVFAYKNGLDLERILNILSEVTLDDKL